MDLPRAQEFMQQVWTFSNKGWPSFLQELQSRLLEPAALVRDTALGRVRRLAPAVTYSATRAYWNDPFLVPRGSSAPEWQRTP